MPHTLMLSAAVTAHGQQVDRLTLRLPTGKDLRSCGLPYKLTAEGEIAINAAPMHRMIAELAAVPPSTIDQLSAGDWNNAAMVVLGFITGSAETPPGPTTKTPPTN